MTPSKYKNATSFVPVPLKDRFWKHVVQGDGCWEWKGALDPKGYGRVAHNGKMVRAHRVAFALTYGPIPKGEGYHGTCVLHHCDNPPCVRPDHLFLGTNTDNIRDRDSKRRHPNTVKTHCKRGHPLAGDNLYVEKQTGARKCRSCWRIRYLERKRKVAPLSEDSRTAVAA